MSQRRHPLLLVALMLAVVVLAALVGTTTAMRSPVAGPPASTVGPAVGGGEADEDWDHPDERDDWFYAKRTAGNPNFSVAEAAARRALAAEAVIAMKHEPSSLLQGLQNFVILFAEIVSAGIQ